jgi:hypothetical protein
MGGSTEQEADDCDDGEDVADLVDIDVDFRLAGGFGILMVRSLACLPFISG